MTKLKPILCTPSSVIKTFSGLMSRWITFLSWMSRRPLRRW
jgi:hypothetical protein